MFIDIDLYIEGFVKIINNRGDIKMKNFVVVSLTHILVCDLVTDHS